MEQILDSPVNEQRTLNYAGFWIRFGAYIIDAIVMSFVQVILAYVFYGGYSFMEPNYSLTLISLVVGVLYFAVMESSSKQATLGKMAVGIKVGNEKGESISFGNALGRYLGKILSALILLIGFMMAGWDDKKQALHDKLAGTYVFYSPQ
jgi:uncharacterized RDD family membrane protein YckC